MLGCAFCSQRRFNRTLEFMTMSLNGCILFFSVLGLTRTFKSSGRRINEASFVKYSTLPEIMGYCNRWEPRARDKSRSSYYPIGLSIKFQQTWKGSDKTRTMKQMGIALIWTWNAKFSTLTRWAHIVGEIVPKCRPMPPRRKRCQRSKFFFFFFFVTKKTFSPSSTRWSSVFLFIEICVNCDLELVVCSTLWSTLPIDD